MISQTEEELAAPSLEKQESEELSATPDNNIEASYLRTQESTPEEKVCKPYEAGQIF
jgi:hypothetical protein